MGESIEIHMTSKTLSKSLRNFIQSQSQNKNRNQIPNQSNNADIKENIKILIWLENKILWQRLIKFCNSTVFIKKFGTTM
jgi:hypothetical protein